MRMSRQIAKTESIWNKLTSSGMEFNKQLILLCMHKLRKMRTNNYTCHDKKVYDSRPFYKCSTNQIYLKAKTKRVLDYLGPKRGLAAERCPVPALVSMEVPQNKIGGVWARPLRVILCCLTFRTLSIAKKFNFIRQYLEGSTEPTIHSWNEYVSYGAYLRVTWYDQPFALGSISHLI